MNDMQSQSAKLPVMNMRLSLLALPFFAYSCATTPIDRSVPGPTAEVHIDNISPAAGSQLTESTVLVAEIKYSIDHFQPRAEYYIAPLFASNRGTDVTFNEYEQLTEGTRISVPTGTIVVRYPLIRELRSSQLARPIRLWFYPDGANGRAYDPHYR